jgi:hypothetical protein
MISLLDQYKENTNYRIFLVSLFNFNLDKEVDDTGKLLDNVIQKILNLVDTTIYRAELIENKVDFKFVLHQSNVTVENLELLIRSLGNSVGTESYDLSKVKITEL